MSVVNIVKNVKDVHKQSVILVKIGTFVNVFGKDAYIISYL
ncbi:MAG: hypothetical protein IJ223_06275 [Clostridia bacterium]|nr:hypothetical protein [Clostridia bacterium]